MMSNSPQQPTLENLERARRMFAGSIQPKSVLQQQQPQQQQLQLQQQQLQQLQLDDDEELSLRSIIATKPKVRDVRQFFRENVDALNNESDDDSLDY